MFSVKTAAYIFLLLSFILGVGCSKSSNSNNTNPTNDSITSSNVKSVSISSDGTPHSLLLTEDGDVYATGFNQHGQLCLGSDQETYTTWQKTNISNIDKIFAYRNVSFAVEKNTGDLYVCGNNQHTQLGITDADNSSIINRWTRVLIDNVIDVQASKSDNWSFFFALQKDGYVKGIGYNHTGQLGLGESNNIDWMIQRTSWYSTLDYITEYNEYGVDNLVEVTAVAKIAVGNLHALALVTINGEQRVVVTGKGLSGELGLGNTTQIDNWQDTNLEDIVDITAGESLSLAIDSTGQLWAAGELYGSGKIYTWTAVAEMTDIASVYIGGLDNLYAITDAGELKVLGYNDGVFGLGHKEAVTSWTYANIQNVKAVRGGNLHSVVLLNDGEVWHTGFPFVGDVRNSYYLNWQNTQLDYIDKIYGTGTAYFAKTEPGKLYAVSAVAGGRSGENYSEVWR
ncbi:hypothetical protein OAT97_00025 [Gammaproteobacteria bacterium]|nr:hypothetical protein [Gammaproteobacteria bacterium]